MFHVTLFSIIYHFYLLLYYSKKHEKLCCEIERHTAASISSYSVTLSKKKTATLSTMGIMTTYSYITESLARKHSPGKSNIHNVADIPHIFATKIWGYKNGFFDECYENILDVMIFCNETLWKVSNTTCFSMDFFVTL